MDGVGVVVRRGEGLTVFGHRGSGKTTWEQTFLAGGAGGGRPVSSCVIIDSKQLHHEWDAFAAALGYEVTADYHAISRAPRVIWRPPLEAFMDRGGWRKPGRVGYTYTLGLEEFDKRMRTDPNVAHVLVWEEAIHSLPSVGAHLTARRLVIQMRGFGGIPMIGTQSVVHTDTLAWDEAETIVGFQTVDLDAHEVIRRRRGVDASVLGELRSQVMDGEAEWAMHRRGWPDWATFAPVARCDFAHQVRSAAHAHEVR